jgi:hypothetical protein
MLAGVVCAMTLIAAHTDPPAGLADAAAAAKRTLHARHPEEAARIDRGVDQAARYWQLGDGDAAAFCSFATAEFLPQGSSLDATFQRLEFAFERVGGYLTSMSRDLKMATDVEMGPALAIDERLAGWDMAAHVAEDLFANKVAFVILLNFPVTTLEERLHEGGRWSSRQWAEARLVQRVTARVPADLRAKATYAYARADDYTSNYNIYMHHLLAADGARLFPPGQRLISHWNLRDELKARYADRDGLAKQRMIQRVMERIVRQEIPAVVVNNPRLDWEPESNDVRVSSVTDAEPPPGATAEPRREREPDERYRRWLDIFAAERLADPFQPDPPRFVDRRFEVDREIPEKEVRALLEAVLDAPVGKDVAGLVAQRLGRPLEPFDIWYAGFKPSARYAESELDARTKKRYPTAAEFARDIPRILVSLGFTDERAAFVAKHIAVDPSRGAGHALAATRRDDQAHLRTRVGADGMDYKGYNIAVHELGHNVEQTFSLHLVEHTLLQGVPNNAFTEALAFVFQERDLELLGLPKPEAADERLRVLESFWTTRELAGVALVDADAWHWLYDHPEATPAEFREAVVRIAEDVWNRHYAPLFGVRDVPLLAIYSHLVEYGLYMPDYPMGHLIQFQLEQHFRTVRGSLGAEFERVARQGALTPDAWMRGAVGGPLSAEPLLRATRQALSSTEARP